MKITCKHEPFVRAYNAVRQVVSSRATRPVLQYIKMGVGAFAGQLTATDSEDMLTHTLEGVTDGGDWEDVLLPPQFGNFLRECRESEFTLATGDGKITVKAGRAKLNFQTIKPDDFPSDPPAEEGGYHLIGCAELGRLIHQTIYATDESSNRFALGGILIDGESAAIRATATDGRRIATISALAESHDPVAGSNRIVPAKSARHLSKVLSAAGDQKCRVFFDSRGSGMRVEADQFTFQARLLEGRFPKIADAMPSGSPDIDLRLPVGALASAIRQAAITSDHETHGLEFDFRETELRLSAVAATVGTSRVVLNLPSDSVVSWRDCDNLFLNHRLVSEALAVLPVDREIAIRIHSESSLLDIWDDATQFRFVLVGMIDTTDKTEGKDDGKQEGGS